MTGMPGYYLPSDGPDLDDFFAQVWPLPPRTSVPGGMLFIAPFDPKLDSWFAYVRRDDQVARFEGPLESVQAWARNQQVSERWLYSTLTAEYVPWSDGPLL